MTTVRPIGFWLKLVDRLIDDGFARTLEEHGVTRRQWQLLTILDANAASGEQLSAAIRPFLQGEAAAAVDAGEPATAEENLEELMESDWVMLEGGLYALTERGRTLYEKLRVVVTGIRDQVSEGVSEADYATTLVTLERMATNLGWRDSD
ncbi:transcriptional regulator [Planctomonas deserti]|jgi:DNA-binding PadR family transcriptional regulator|uniref:transcriptional regulator n=1 Tax=Planctomonas deserti TaxID=2144185 RepID=UPI000D39C5B3|nr:transcriptional regulator [Planctomonas deserti]